MDRNSMDFFTTKRVFTWFRKGKENAIIRKIISSFKPNTFDEKQKKHKPATCSNPMSP